MDNVALEQDQILKELNDIEGELDILLSSNGNQSTIDYLSKAENVDLRKLAPREQIFAKAREVETLIDVMAKDLNDVRGFIETQNKKGQEGISIIVDNKPMRIDEKLNIYYETLLWMENAAVDLNFQVDQVAKKLGIRGELAQSS